MASDHGGINVIDRRKGKTIEVRSQKSSPRGLMSNGISCIYADKQGCVWVGDVSMGVSYFAEPMFKFGIDNLQIDNIDPDFVATGEYHCRRRAWRDVVWHKRERPFEGRQLNSGHKKLFRTSAQDANSLSSDIVVSLCTDGDGGMWIGTFLGGLCHYDGHRFTRYNKNPNVAEAAAADNVWVICKEDDRLWVGSLAKGLAMLDLKSGKWTQIGEKEGLANNYVRKVVSMRDGRMAIGTANGLCILDSRKDNEITTLDSNTLANSAVTDLYYDSRDLLWVCGNDGINVIDGKTLKLLSHIGRQDGLPTDATLSVIEDKNRVYGWLQPLA